MTLHFLKISRQIVPAERVRVLSSCRDQCGCPRVSDVRAVSLGATSPALSRSASGCFPPDGIARFYPAQLFVQAGPGTRTFSAQTKEWQCLLLKESQPGSKEGMTAVFSGCLTGSSMTGREPMGRCNDAACTLALIVCIKVSTNAATTYFQGLSFPSKLIFIPIAL